MTRKASRRLLIAFAALAGLAATSAAFAQGESERAIRPGYWAFTTSTILASDSKGRQCVRPDQIDEFMAGPHNRHYHCTYPTKSVANGRASFDGTCVSKHGNRFNLAVAGAYSPTHFTLNGEVHGALLLGIPMTAPISIDARWLGATCPPGAK